MSSDADSYETAPDQLTQRVIYHIPFPARTTNNLIMNQPPSPRSSIVSSTSSPLFITPTISEIELLTLENRSEQDMADYLRNDTLALESWERLQADLQTARELEALARERRRSVTAQWERFKYRRFDRKIQRGIERERRRWIETNTETRRPESPFPLVVRNNTPSPLNATLPGYRQTTPLSETDPNAVLNLGDNNRHPIVIDDDDASEEDFRQTVNAYEQTPAGIQERQNYERRQRQDQELERTVAQIEQIDRNRTNARFGQLGVRRAMQGVKQITNRMNRRI